LRLLKVMPLLQENRQEIEERLETLDLIYSYLHIQQGCSHFMPELFNPVLDKLYKQPRGSRRHMFSALRYRLAHERAEEDIEAANTTSDFIRRAIEYFPREL
jgi:hypothetical protein